jgi:pimeloyl-ACP methyl ester carboxylesterase
VQGYVNVRGHQTWVYDDQRDAPPLLLLHGALGGSEATFSTLLPYFSENFRIVMFDRIGHGRTADTADPFHYRTMAEETAGVIEALGLAPVNAFGYSDGGIVLLDLALIRPEFLRAQVLLSANYHYDVVDPVVSASFDKSSDPTSFVATVYANSSPDGAGHWKEVVQKGAAMVFSEPTYRPDELAAIPTPTLVMASDDDVFPLAHTVSLYEALPLAQLAVVPGTSHMLGFENPALVAQLATAFINNPAPAATMMPVRRCGAQGNSVP